MKAIFRLFIRLLPLAGLLFAGGCPQMTSAVSGGGSPLSATGERSTAVTDKTTDSEDTAAPPAAAPLPPSTTREGVSEAPPAGTDYSTMMRRMDAPSGSEAGDTTVVARESRGGILGAPSEEERLEDPEYQLICNVITIRGPISGRSWTGIDDFYRKLTAGTLNLAQIVSTCDLTNVMSTRSPESAVEAEAVASFRDAEAPGYYLFFRRNDREEFEGRHVRDNKTFATMEELRSALADTKYIGDKWVGAVRTVVPVTPELEREIVPRLNPEAIQRINP
jgi:hypothetical protein